MVREEVYVGSSAWQGYDLRRLPDRDSPPEGLSFQEDPTTRLTVGQKLYFDLRDRGYRTILLPDRLASTYVVHLAHATQMLNAAEFGFDRVARKWRRVMGPWLTSESFQALLRDDRLDR